MIKEFSEFIENQTVRKIKPDKERAKSLLKESERKFRVLDRQMKSLGIDKDLANEYILLCYDCLMFLIRAKMVLEGYYASGKGAHEAEISYLKILNFKDLDIQFLDQMRYYRNGMLYYGTNLDEEYAKKVIEFTKKNYFKLRKILEG